MLRSVPFGVGVFLVSSGTTLLVAALVLAGMAAWQPASFPSDWPLVVPVMVLPGLVFLVTGALLMYWSAPPAPEARRTDWQAELERLAQRVRDLEARLAGLPEAPAPLVPEAQAPGPPA